MASRPPLRWSDLAGARVGVWGLGVEGTANLRQLESLGAEVVLVDDRPPAAELHGVPVLATRDGGAEALARCDVVVKTPGISRYRPDAVELARAVPLTGGLGLWLEGTDRSRVVCITGTKGKSTTTAIVGHLLRGLGVPALVGGNIGRPPWDPGTPDGAADDPGGPSGPAGDPRWVVETSSFQATDLSSSPPLVAVTSLHPDHLDWHGDAERYYADKLSLCRQPGADVTVAADAQPLRERSGLLGPQVRWVDGGPARADDRWVEALGLLGPHNLRNARIARAVLREWGVEGADDPEALAGAAAGFEALPSRLQPLGTVAGVSFVDDSLSTNALPTVAALDAFSDRRVALLVGGFDRGLDYEPLADAVAARDVPTLVVTLPDNGPRIGATIGARGAPAVEVVAAEDLAAAVGVAFAWARPDGAVLLSPAAPSFGRFADYRARARAFADAVHRQGAVVTPARRGPAD